MKRFVKKLISAVQSRTQQKELMRYLKKCRNDTRSKVYIESAETLFEVDWLALVVANEVCPATDRFRIVYDRPLTAEEFQKVKSDSVKWVQLGDNSLQAVMQDSKVVKPAEVLEQFEEAKTDPNWIKMSELVIQEVGESNYYRFYDNPNS